MEKAFQVVKTNFCSLLFPYNLKITYRIEIANPKLDIQPKIVESATEPDWMKFLRPPYMPDNSKVAVIANYKVQEYVPNLKCTLSFERVN